MQTRTHFNSRLLLTACSLAITSLFTLQGTALAESEKESSTTEQPVTQVAEAKVSPMDQEEMIGHIAAPANPIEETKLPTLESKLADPNPSDQTWHGSHPGRFRLPSVKIDMGANTSADKVLSDVTKMMKVVTPVLNGLTSGGKLDAAATSDLQLSLDSVLTPLQNGLRLDYDLDVTIASFSGSPFDALKIGNKKVALGLNIGGGTRGYVNVKTTPEFTKSLTDLSKSLPDVANIATTASGLLTQSSTLTQSVSGLTTGIASLSTQVTSLLANPLAVTPAAITQLNTDLTSLTNNIDSLTGTASSLTKSADQSVKTAENIINTLKSATGGGLQLDTVNDAHLTFAVSGAYPVFENQDFQVSVGTNLKLFVLPSTLPLQSLGINSNMGLFGQIKLNEVTGLSSVSNSAQSTLDKIKPAITSANSLITTANSVKTDLQSVQTSVSQASSNPAALAGVATQATALLQKTATAQQEINNTVTGLNSALTSVNDLQKNITSSLSNVALKGSVVTPGGAGFGVDLGVRAVMFKSLSLGLVLQNPLVIWPGTEKNVSFGLSSANGKTGLGVTLDETTAKQANYGGFAPGSEPFAALLTAAYSFDQLLPNFAGLSANGAFEFVANGRTPALTVGVQKQFGPAYVGLGGRAGGPTPLIFFQGGLRTAGAFGLDLQVGLSPTSTGLPIPGASILGMANLGMYLQF